MIPYKSQIQWILPAFDVDFLVCVRLVPRICPLEETASQKTSEDGKFSLNLALFSANKDVDSLFSIFFPLKKILQVWGEKILHVTAVIEK